MADNVTELPPAYKIDFDHFQEVSFAHTTWVATLQEGMTLEHMQDPMFWSHVDKRMKAGDIVLVKTFDHSLFAEMYVRAAEPEVQVQLLRQHKLGKDVTLPDDFSIKWNFGKKGWDVYRADRLIKDGRSLPTQEDAAAWLDSHRKMMAA